MQKKRYAKTNYYANSDVSSVDLRELIPLDAECMQLLEQAKEKLHLSLRVVHKTVKIARSIADYGGIEIVQREHILEALQYRTHDWVVKQ
jgi:magnesium chelatase family protein